ncbi:alpha/beta-hydrolase [Penicillium cataractarum]|uniref:Alpha/beta-hydrolase n=1 Tax=Penicillium cataractarum TaxID=2100454 RepID=A0A9W9UUD6_9EURO|nr:alpha/beta-hydrolase [Penicillium cataractarum]KAJ5355091.1 alpha/beta-hydrolase [Penicillium cataractarum]
MTSTLSFPQTPTIKTYHQPSPTGQIYILDSSPSNPHALPTLLLIHGNSSCTRIWHPLLTTTPLTRTHRILALDLPGHGNSENASTPEETYTMQGYAECILTILADLGISQVSVLGWSLGGHIAIEMLSLIRSNPTPKLKVNGIMLVGTPPSHTPDQVMLAFSKTPPSPALPLASKDTLTAEEVRIYATATSGPPYESWQIDAVGRTEGVARANMFTSFAAGQGVDQVGVVEAEALRGGDGVVFAVVNGTADPFINLDYLDGLGWGRLVGGECVRMEGLGHAPFWEDSERFFPYLVEFLGGV